MTADLPLMKTVPTLKEFFYHLDQQQMHLFKKNNGSEIILLIISSEEMEDIMKVVKSLKASELLKKELVKQLKLEQKKKRKIFVNFIKNISWQYNRKSIKDILNAYFC